MNKKEEHLLIVKRYRDEGLSFRAIAKRMGLSKSKVEKDLKAYECQRTGTKPVVHLLEPYRAQLIEWMEVKHMTASLIHKRLLEKKLNISESSVRRYLHSLKRPEVYVHIPTSPGRECQIDFGYLGRFLKEGKLVKVWVFCQVLSHSRYAFYKAVTDQTTDTFFRCQMEAMEFFGGVPATLKIDNLGAGVLEADFYQPLIQKQYSEMAAHYKATVITCRIRRGQDKGIVESGVKYAKNNFLKNLETRELSELHAQLGYWNKTVCNLREHGTLRATPVDIFIKEEKRKLKPLPVKRYEIFRYEPRTVNQFGHIYYRYNQYSVPSHFAGETVLLATNGTVLRVFKDDVQVAMHLVDPYKGKNVTEDHHQPIHKRAKTTEYYRQLLEPIGEYALRLFEKLMALYPYEWKRMCNGIRKLTEKYAKSIVNKACQETLNSTHSDYRQVKKIVVSLTKPSSAELKQAALKGVAGYAHDLKKYDSFVTLFKEEKMNTRYGTT